MAARKNTKKLASSETPKKAIVHAARVSAESAKKSIKEMERKALVRLHAMEDSAKKKFIVVKKFAVEKKESTEAHIRKYPLHWVGGALLSGVILGHILSRHGRRD